MFVFAMRFRLSSFFAQANFDFATTMKETWLGDGMREDEVVGGARTRRGTYGGVQRWMKMISDEEAEGGYCATVRRPGCLVLVGLERRWSSVKRR
jgi:hypothetical protein